MVYHAESIIGCDSRRHTQHRRRALPAAHPSRLLGMPTPLISLQPVALSRAVATLVFGIIACGHPTVGRWATNSVSQREPPAQQRQWHHRASERKFLVSC